MNIRIYNCEHTHISLAQISKSESVCVNGDSQFRNFFVSVCVCVFQWPNCCANLLSQPLVVKAVFK